MIPELGLFIPLFDSLLPPATKESFEPSGSYFTFKVLLGKNESQRLDKFEMLKTEIAIY